MIPGLFSLPAQQLSIGWRPVLSHALQRARDLFLGLCHRGGYLAHPLPEPGPLLLKAMRLRTGLACGEGMRLTDAGLPSRAELRALSDNALLARLRGLPRDSAAREAICEILVSRYAGLVRSCVRPYRQSPEPTEDLLQVGYVGLLKAINNFDPDCGDSLVAYAQPGISGEIKRHFRNRRWQLRVRRVDQELLLKMRAAVEALTQQLGRSPDDSELARYLGVTDDDVRYAREASWRSPPTRWTRRCRTMTSPPADGRQGRC